MTAPRREVASSLDETDPFELPDWVGEREITWHADDGAWFGHHIHGRVTADGETDLPCDLLAIDQAYPVEVADPTWRRRAHLAWRNGEVLLVTRAGRITLAVPGHEFTADLVLTALSRFTRSVGGSPDRCTAALRLGGGRP